MFTGIIEEVGTIKSISNLGRETRIVIQASKILMNTAIGDSIAVNGICLTVTDMADDNFTADVMPETLRRSNLANLSPRSQVNLERALKLSSRLGGHIVSGHIDGTGVLLSAAKEQNAIVMRIRADANLLRYMVEKGSVALDGVSLTLVSAGFSEFAVSIIPHSAKSTIISSYKPGDPINIECDLIGKYVERLLMFNGLDANHGDGILADNKAGGISIDYLKMHGF